MQDAQTLRRNFLWNTFGQLTYMLCQFLCGILVVRLAGEQVSGVYNTALTATGIFLSIASYGMYSFQVSDIRGKYGASTYIRSRVWTCALAVALCIGFVAVSALTGENPYSAQQSVCVLLFLGYRMVESLTDIYNAIDQRSGRLDIVGKTYAVRGAVTLASFTLTLWLTQDIVLTLALMLGASLVVFFVYSLPQARAFYAPGSSASYRSKGQPAATETTALSASCPRTGESTSSIRCGFTATMTTSAASATSRASRQGRMPRGCVAAHSLSQSFAQAQICSGSSAFERSSPSAMACAILPNPINPSFISFLSILGLPHFPIFSEQPDPQLGRPSNGSSGLGSGPLPAKWRRAIRSATPPSITSCTSWARTAA